MTLQASKPTYVIGVARWGRSSYGALRLLARKGYIPEDTAEYLIQVLDADRKRIDIEAHEIVAGTRAQFSTVREVANFLNGFRDEKEPDPEHPGERRLTKKATAVGERLTTDKNENRRLRPDRLKLDDIKYETDDYVIIFHGVSHEEAPSAFQKREIHAGFGIGYDEYAASALANGKNGGNPLRRWEAIAIDRKDRKLGPNDVVALGAAGLGDPTFHALLHSANRRYNIRNGRPDLSEEPVVFTDPGYDSIYWREMPQLKGRTRNYREEDPLPTRKLEHMVVLHGKPGVAIVNTAGTIKDINALSAGQLMEQLEEGSEWYERNGLAVPRSPDWIKSASSRPWLRISGHELGFSESLIMVPGYNMEDKTLMGILDGFGPISYWSAEREEYIEKAYKRVMDNVGDAWIQPPRLEAFLSGRSRRFF